MNWRKACLAIIISSLFLYCANLSGSEDSYLQARNKLVILIDRDVRDTRLYLDKIALESRVMAAIATVPRHEFVPPESRHLAYLNRPLAIGFGQTISQPYIVAVMTDLLRTNPNDIVLEIGTGSGYQAAILAELVSRVYTIEIIEPLGQRAKKTLQQLGYRNVETKIGDGYYGWEEYAPFDAIVVTAVASHIPAPLIRQLKRGGRMILPVGTRFLTQQLVIVEKDAQGAISTRQILPVRFVPLTGGH